MTNLGILLEYLSEIGCGSWAEFKRALAISEASSGKPAVWVASDLAALAHIELHPDTRDWAVCPPALVELPSASDEATGLLCGARSPRFLARVNRISDALGGSLEPSIEGVVVGMRFRLPSKDALRSLAEQAGLPLLSGAAERLATCLPTVPALLRAARQEQVVPSPGLEQLMDTPGGRRRSPWLDWGAAPAADAPGVYRQEWGFRTVYWWRGLLDGAADSRRTSKAVALYAHCPDLMTYEQRSSTVQFPADARPPDLHLRALVLCSGSLPTLVAPGRLGAKQVPPGIAHIVIQKLGQGGA